MMNLTGCGGKWLIHDTIPEFTYLERLSKNHKNLSHNSQCVVLLDQSAQSRRVHSTPEHSYAAYNKIP